MSATISIDNEACRKTSAGDQHHAADHQLQNIRSKNHFFHLKNDEKSFLVLLRTLRPKIKTHYDSIVHKIKLNEVLSLVGVLFHDPCLIDSQARSGKVTLS